MKVDLKSPAGRYIDSVYVGGPGIKVDELQNAIMGTKMAIRPNRQRLSLPPAMAAKDKKPIVLERGHTLSEYGLKDGDAVIIKDLGPQVRWRTVFFVEYLGPLLIHQVYFLRGFNHASLKAATLSFTQILAYACITFHFLKREYETFFIHRFSHATMPLRNLFKNCTHYWLLSGFLLAHYLYLPDYKSPSLRAVLGWLLIFLLAEIGNFYTHCALKNLRPPGTTRRAIPRGFAFDLVSCPNYSFEILAWIAFSGMTGLWSSWLFTIVATAQMYLWAVKKHRQYRHEFPDYPKNRRILVPYIL